MRVAILSCFPPYRGGISQFNTALAAELGKSCIVKAFNFTRQYPEILFPGKTQYVGPDDAPSPVESTRILDSALPHTYVRTAREILRWQPDIVIVRYWMSWFAPSLGYVTRRLKSRGVKVISILDNVIPHERHFFDKALTRYFLTGSSACITLCDAVCEDLREIRPDIPCRVIPHPLYSHFGSAIPREEALAKLGLDPSKKTLLFFGLIREYKGLDILLEAFFGLPPEEYQLIVCGEPYGSFDRYGELIAANGARHTLSVNLNFVPDGSVSLYFSGADLCVLPYRSATQSGVSAISFHFEVPMVVTDVGGLKQTISDTGCGLLSTDITPDAVRERIADYFADPAVAEECRESIRRLKRILSWESFSGTLLDFASTL